MTYFGPHERTVVQGDNQCACGRDWPCEFSAEGRWKALREHLERLHRTARDEAQGTAVKGTPAADRIEGLADGLRDVLRVMDDMEARQ